MFCLVRARSESNLESVTTPVFSTVWAGRAAQTRSSGGCSMQKKVPNKPCGQWEKAPRRTVKTGEKTPHTVGLERLERRYGAETSQVREVLVPDKDALMRQQQSTCITAMGLEKGRRIWQREGRKFVARLTCPGRGYKFAVRSPGVPVSRPLSYHREDPCRAMHGSSENNISKVEMELKCFINCL